jgi:phosphatidate cytidylyltransferase
MPSASSADNTSNDKRTAFGKRLVSTVALWIVMGGAMWFGHVPTMLGIAMLLGIGGAVEYASVFQQTDETKSRGHAMLVVFISITWWICFWVQKGWIVPAYLDFVVMFLAIQMAFLLCYTTDVTTEGPRMLRRIMSSVFGVFYTVVLFGYIARLIILGAGNDHSGLHAVPLLLYVIAVTKFSDMGAYVVGSWVGSDHYMCPRISPKKTWEGFIGAFVGGFIASCTMLWLMPEKLMPITWTHSLVLVPILVLLAVTGDLAESILKRCLHVKDAGHKLPGIGGILDLTDSLLYTVPAFYGYLMMAGG